MNKILIVNNNLEIGGVQKALVNLLREISKEYDVTLLLFNKSGAYLDEIPSGVKVIQASSWYRFLGIAQSQSKNKKDYLIRGALAFITKIFGRTLALKIMSLTQKKLNDRFDVAISYLHNGGNKSFYGGCNEFVLDKVDAAQKIAFLHCDFAHSGANTRVNIKNYKRFDKIAACSEGCLRSFKNCVDFDEKRLYKVANCHDFDRILNLAKEDPVVYSKDEINIVSVARLSPEKGIERAIKAIKYVVSKGLNVKYSIVGDGAQRSELENLTKELGVMDHVVFYGNSNNPYRYMANADMLLIPSYHEAAPIVIDEARCLSVPILATETTSSIDMIINRNCGWVCENSQNGIEENLLSLLQNTCELMNKKKEMRCHSVDNSIAIKDFKILIGE